MPQEGQDLFNVMDAALKRQGEGKAKQFRGPGQAAPRATPGPAMPQRGAAAAAGAPAHVPGAPEAGSADAGAPDAAAQEQNLNRGLTRRLYPMPDSARSVPPGGLSPTQVLRGTVFSSSRNRQVSGALEPPAAEPARAEEPPPPPPPPPPPAQPSTRQAPVRPIASGTLKSVRPSVILPPLARPPAAAPPPAPARTGSGRLEPAAAQAHGLFVRTEVAVIAVIGATIALVLAFSLGHSMGRRSALLNSPENGRGADRKTAAPAPKANVDPRNLTYVPNLEGQPVPPKPTAETPGAAGGASRPTAGTPVATPPPAGKFTIQLVSYWPQDRARARKLVDTLKSRDRRFADARIIERGVRGNATLAVCVGHFGSASDPAVEPLRRAVLALNPSLRVRADLVEE
jgi:hypothetical protein